MTILELVIEPDREDHIARHGVTLEEAESVVFGQSLVTRERNGYYRVLGQTFGGRYLAVFIAPRQDTGVFGLVTARDATLAERRRLQASFRGR
jgi:uncharacterized DUF497 family protein